MSKITKAEAKILNDIYQVLWCEGYYDNRDAPTGKFSRPLSDKMTELNKTMKFKT